MAKVTPVENLGQVTAGSFAEGKGAQDRGSSHQRQHRRDRSRGTVIFQTRSGVRNLLTTSGWYESAMAMRVRKFLRGPCFAVTALIFLVLALFLREIFVLAQVPTNVELDIILTAVFAVFVFEFMGLSLTDTSYLLGFFFWMDLVGALSMVFDISYMAGSDATRSVKLDESATGENFVLVRAARATKLGARAGRLSRVLKILRFMPFMNNDKDEKSKAKVAKVISGQLTNVLSVRVAFASITLVVVLPFFGIFYYPEMDDSMAVWAEILARDVTTYSQAIASNASSQAAALAQLASETAAFADFSSSLSYGPFAICYGAMQGGSFVCDPGTLSIPFSSVFERPRRNASIREVSIGSMQASFNLSLPRQQEAGSAIGMILFMIITMCVFALVMSNSISKVALEPLERMLDVVRQRCQQIFRYTDDLKEDMVEEEVTEEEEDFDDFEQSSEFQLLEKVVAKLALIAHLTTNNPELELKDNMNENEIMVLNWMQGTQVKASPRGLVVDAHSHDGSGRTGTLCSSIMTSIPPDVKELLGSEDFDPLDLKKEMKIQVGVYIIVSQEASRTWVRNNVPEAQIFKLVSSLEGKYMPNSFHNFSHGLDVLYTVSLYLRRINADRFIPDTAHFWLMIAALGHDVGHLGVNNQYLIESSHELAVKYNDRSPMENMHCALLFKVASDAEANVFAQLEKDLFKEMRKGIINAILHTDMVKHNDMVKEMGLLYQMNSETFDALDPGAAAEGSQATFQLFTGALLHCSDVSNPTRPWEVCKRYAHLCLDEFFAQGDLEKAAGIPVQMLNDRDKVNRPNSQVGFIEFVITPLVESIVSIFPQLDGIAVHLGRNIASWAEVWQDQYSPPADAVSKVNVRVQKVAARCKAVMRVERRLDTRH